MFHKQWGLMKPGLQWACLLCTHTSSAVAPLPDTTGLIRLCLPHVPSVCPQYVLWHEEAGSPAGSRARVWLPQLTTSLCCQLGGHPTAVTGRHADVLVGWQLLNSANHVRVSCPLKFKVVIVSFPYAGSRLSKTCTAHCIFLVLTSFLSLLKIG